MYLSHILEIARTFSQFFLAGAEYTRRYHTKLNSEARPVFCKLFVGRRERLSEFLRPSTQLPHHSLILFELFLSRKEMYHVERSSGERAGV
jgi:hypothetical protein